uniref:Uncharacterized protein n=1 Tax=Oryza brachyantha TaxID=4533 RepID=J3NCN0_ORYBR
MNEKFAIIPSLITCVTQFHQLPAASTQARHCYSPPKPGTGAGASIHRLVYRSLPLPPTHLVDAAIVAQPDLAPLPPPHRVTFTIASTSRPHRCGLDPTDATGGLGRTDSAGWPPTNLTAIEAPPASLSMLPLAHPDSLLLRWRELL